MEAECSCEEGKIVDDIVELVGEIAIHFGELTIPQVKEYLAGRGIPVR